MYKRFTLAFCSLLALVAPVMTPLAGLADTPAASPLVSGTRMNVPDVQRSTRPAFHGVPKYTTNPGPDVTARGALAQSAAGLTLPLWGATATSFGKSYNFVMVGTNPLNNTIAAPSVIDTEFINLNITFADGTQLGTTAPACGDSSPVVLRTYQSPLFQNANYTSNGQYVGYTQYIDAFQRAAFWKATQGSGYHVLFVPGSDYYNGLTINLTVPSSEGGVNANPSSAGCAIGLINYSWFDGVMQSIVKSQFHRPDRLPIILMYNTFLYQGSTANCCILGYHGSYSSSTGTQAYSVGAYYDKGIFSNQGNTSALSHELGEFVDDPLGNNPTPAWGHTGQVPGCQNNLEVGDPLSGKTFSVTSFGFSYYLQELAFPSWFYRQSPSYGSGGKDSFLGSFTSGQSTICK